MGRGSQERLSAAVARLRDGGAQWRRLGLLPGAGAALRLAARPLGTRARRARLRLAPLRVDAGELRLALAGDPVAILRGPARAALPTVMRFERELDALSGPERTALLRRAELILDHTFDLLGSGPVALGQQIDWLADFKSGRRWPAAHISQLPIVLGDGSDVKVPWELSRFQHLPLLAAAYRLTCDERWLEEIGAQLRSWISANPVEFGPNWACTMDVAIRASNWVATLAMIAEPAAERVWLQEALGSLLLHGRFIRTHLEWAPVRGNHYLSDIVGLLIVSAVFGGCKEGRAWRAFAIRELAAELPHEVRPDGCDHEASIPYHRLVAELFICGTQAADVLAPGVLTHEHHERLERMVAFTAAYTRPDGLAPQIGDADDGRFLPLGGYGGEPRSHLHLFAQAGITVPRVAGSTAYPHGGYWVMRGGGLFVLVRCGDVGVGGLGSHAHNDALSFELALEEQPLIIDPGSYVYTADPIERNRFRSTAYHSTLRIDGAEQNPLRLDSLFTMEDRRRAETTEWNPDPPRPSFAGRHHGYRALPAGAVHARRLELDIDAATLHIADTVLSCAAHELEWTFPLAGCEAQASESVAIARFPSGPVLEIDAPGVELWIEHGWVSPSYGRRVRAPFVRGRRRSRPGTDVTQIAIRVQRFR